MPRWSLRQVHWNSPLGTLSARGSPQLRPSVLQASIEGATAAGVADRQPTIAEAIRMSGMSRRTTRRRTGARGCGGPFGWGSLE